LEKEISQQMPKASGAPARRARNLRKDNPGLDAGAYRALTLMLQKSRMLQIQGVKGEAVIYYRKSLTTRDMRYHRLSQRVNNMAIFTLFLDFTMGDS